ncbi:MAG TPA: DegT/DnrJ/EryC1/StrS family aminotransferase [Tenuifilaceae bacterium]|mgnify:CR=1 FL=1|nr:DegT/DnrJ/EryC1/StrS family aminotransferase [Tenuifilaceae bacterium]HPE18922.1 DegT/DnrJ/EryC1/StrS family aminotransferase [Tenuifilaceae bacterium]HPJ46203.1 DegT/DnrJ/EryC1/StrS family aminotransferase [Tenuifilaceae bacterium]HPQ34206.1 DegT/DnrJ/EryC1/StrS family aminotransferase [Tenuifilaceae bacterium]HRX67859.1 DegT/DnrJ/EryC1/StrS family aminotransferase [Tenuifilaceae bacterium]
MINVTKTYLPILEKYQGYVQKIFKSGWLTNNGELTLELEKRLSEYLQVPYLILTSNGTLALQIAYRLLNLKGNVVTTPFSFVATTSSLAWENIEPIFADIDPLNFNIFTGNIEKVINSKTSALLGVHVFGNPCDHKELQKISNQHNLPIIYDAAHAFGVRYNDKSIATLGDVSIFSFHATKVFHTIEGGAIIVKSKELYDRAKLLINFGISGYDEVSDIGINAKMNEFQAAMGLCVLDEVDYIIAEREKVFNKYVNSLKANKNIYFQQINPLTTSNYAYCPVVFENEEVLLKVKSKLNSLDIFPRRYFYPSLEKLNYVRPQNAPIADSISKRILCLPLFAELEWSGQKRIIEVINEYTK